MVAVTWWTSHRKSLRRSSELPAPNLVLLHRPISASATAVSTLIVHAGGFSAACYAPLAEALGGLAFGLDLPGHGGADSDPPPGDATDWNVFARAVADALGRFADAPVILGHSLGATAAIMALSRASVPARALVAFEPILIDPTNARQLAEANALADGALRRRASFVSRQAARERLGAKPPMASFDPRVLEAYLDTCLVSDDAGVRLRFAPAAEAAMYRGGITTGALDLVATISAPMLILAGAASTTMTAEDLALVAQRAPSASCAIVDGVGHFGPFEHPDAVASVVRSWLSTAPLEPPR